MQTQRMRTSYVPVMRCEKMDVTKMFRQRAVIGFFVKEGNSVGVIYERLHNVYGDVCMGASSVRKSQCQKEDDENSTVG
jgi:hypothetical protein